MLRVISIVLSLATAFLLGGGAGAQGRAVGQLLNVKGEVEVRRAGGPVKGTLLLPLQQGDLVVVGKGGAAEVVLYQSGARYALAGGSSAVVNAGGLVRRSGVKPRALRTLRLPEPAAQSFNRRLLGLGTRGSTRGGEGAPAKGTPYGSVRDMPVMLKWTTGADGELAVKITDEAKKVVFETTVPGASRELSVPESALERGKFYVWTVNAAGQTSGGSIGWVRVLLTPEKSALEFLERETQEERRGTPDNPSPILLLAQTYERFGMYDDAMTAYQSAAQMRPNDSGLQDAMKRLTSGG